MTHTNPWQSLRRVITGTDSNGRSKIMIDDHLPNRHMFDDFSGLHEVWTDPGNPLDRTASKDQTERNISIAPERGAVRFRYFTVAPTPKISEQITEAMVREQVADAFASVNSAHHQQDTSRHAAMHITPTIDCIVLLQGRVKLILDDEETELKPFDMVIQRGTNHAWEVIGEEPALFVAVLVDREILNK